MISAALWSKFPKGYVRDKVEPKLLEKGFEVKKILSVYQKDCDLNDVDVVLCMSEMGGHSEIEQIRDIASQYKKQVLFISRKSASWSETFKFLRSPMPAKAIVDTQIDSFCRQYVNLRESGFTYNEMVPKLARYWSNGKLRNAAQLKQYARKLIDQGRAPKYFEEFVEKKGQEWREKRGLYSVESSPTSAAASPETPPAEAPVDSVAEVLGTLEPEVSSADMPGFEEPLKASDEEVSRATSGGKEELEVELQLYREELPKLTAQLQEKNRQLQEKDKKIQELTKSSAARNIVAESKLAAAVTHLKQSVEFGFMTKEQAFDKIIDFVK